MISASIVFYKPDLRMVRKLLDCIKNQVVSVCLVVADNSPDASLRTLVEESGFTYLHFTDNPGFGAAHNRAFASCSESDIHFIVNPDVYFESDCFLYLSHCINVNSGTVCAVPKVIYPDGQLQRLCKLLPTPVNLLARRFFPIFAEKLDYNFELRWFDYNCVAEIPYVSGCFMAIRSDALREIGGFDERFFMYLEDTDLSRRLAKVGKVLFVPDVVITHEFAKQSYKNKKLLIAHVKSTIQYFNKWGWFFDSERKKINSEAITKLREEIKSLSSTGKGL